MSTLRCDWYIGCKDHSNLIDLHAVVYPIVVTVCGACTISVDGGQRGSIRYVGSVAFGSDDDILRSAIGPVPRHWQ